MPIRLTLLLLWWLSFLPLHYFNITGNTPLILLNLTHLTFTTFTSTYLCLPKVSLLSLFWPDLTYTLCVCILCNRTWWAVHMGCQFNFHTWPWEYAAKEAARTSGIFPKTCHQHQESELRHFVCISDFSNSLQLFSLLPLHQLSVACLEITLLYFVYLAWPNLTFAFCVCAYYFGSSTWI